MFWEVNEDNGQGDLMIVFFSTYLNNLAPSDLRLLNRPVSAPPK